MKSTTLRRVAPLAALPLVLAACGGGGGSDAGGESGGGTTLSYWLWDANQQPAYQQCADAFHEANPDITVEITQNGWDDYWSGVSTGFVSETAPDVFTDHLSKYPEFVTQGQLLPLDDYVAADGVDLSQYSEGLADLWVGQDGHRYGLPKDWDTVAIFYNADMVADAGYAPEDLANLTWNPDDGGTYEQLIAHLTVDKNGVRGDEAGFDKNDVAVYGLGLPGSGGANGQTEWSMYTGTTGWTHTDVNPWGTHYNYDDERFQSTIAWWYSLIEKGYMPPPETTVGASMNDDFGAGKYALNVNGSWMINSYYGYDGINVGLAPTPVGPSGERASMFNGLADSIWAGTKHPDEAAKWVEFLGSTACQDLVGQAGVVFPAIPSSAELAKTSFADRGIDVDPFMVQVQDGTTFLFPITDHAADVNAIMQPAMDAVMGGTADVSSLTEANDEVNALFN
ncbi:sugar ABC transporter substrate-binding protein [Actinotalea sp. M2MS4P-6]|uniref:ABC transporter substrate-binding protein n=1 Tax=Actinotalea sp. M2MS4P-6 TaxID=2983762 RepID=UPI0021E4B413|nr:sugar ABC transporter substrate-binding protein [Actinotalea sp. M2MS4P-6]MCV2395683.1 sugar ABC transporter substrate-binding protein [Actinotalea sp. M2MS4P-6]